MCLFIPFDGLLGGQKSGSVVSGLGSTSEPEPEPERSELGIGIGQNSTSNGTASSPIKMTQIHN